MKGWSHAYSMVTYYPNLILNQRNNSGNLSTIRCCSAGFEYIRPGNTWRAWKIIHRNEASCVLWLQQPHLSFDFCERHFYKYCTIIMMAKINENTFLLFIFVTNYISPMSFSMIISVIFFFFFSSHFIKSKSEVQKRSKVFWRLYN